MSSLFLLISVANSVARDGWMDSVKPLAASLCARDLREKYDCSQSKCV